ncbi:GNAT family N-acetyltransferase [Streptomyces virens]|uniref:GNAT family N-acetyltransferase n=1 Tax=Streptomyces virens TaxID=285572 RepID=A0ABP6PEH6_9ACTN|nr:GNAT family N-acetyltransferase [Streptomyces calvus]MBA8974866.1 hypothetical protein [Streptomyces calvus]MYS31220.1 GNAT family N-acetyltransferase [Streptomyces sp. SID7804]
MAEKLRDILDAVARGVFPAADGTVRVVPQPSGRDAGVPAFTAHTVVFTDEDPARVRRTPASADCDPPAASMNVRFLAAFTERTGRRTDTVDVMTVAEPLPGGAPPGAVRIDDPGHPRVVSALERRDEVRVWAVDGGVLVLGRVIAGRLEAAVEVAEEGAEEARHRGLGRRLALAARRLAGDEPVWAQISPGNARRLRAFQAAGYRPVGSQALFPRG